MKILMFGWELPPYNSGGLGVACFGLAKALSAQDIQITFVLPKKLEVAANFIKLVFASEENFSIKTINTLLLPYITSESYKDVYGVRSRSSAAAYGLDLFEEVLRYAGQAKEIAIKDDYDIIHAHDWLSFLAGIEAKEATGKPLVVHVHATEFDRSGENVDPRICEIEKKGMEQADQVIAVSQFTKDLIVSKYNIEPDKIKVVWNGINSQEDSQQTKEVSLLKHYKELGYKIVLFVGRLTMQKGPDYFLEAARKALEHNPNILFVIAGSGDMQNQIINQAVELGISDKVFFPGFLRGQELNDTYKMADLFVMSSISEPFGITSLESLMHGTPVLTSKQSGAAEAITHALKVDFWDTDDMAAKMLAVLEHSSLKQTMSENGKQEVKKFTWDEAATKVSKIYNQLLSRSAYPTA